MKRYEDLSRDELAALTQEELQWYIDIEIAYEGITPVPQPVPVPDFDPGIKQTVNAFEVCGLIVMNIKDAQTIAAIDVYNSDYDYYGAGSNYKYLTEKYGNHEIRNVVFYKKDEVDRIKHQLKDRKEELERYSSDKREWDKYQDETRKCHERVMNAHYEALEYQRKLAYGKQQYERFLGLAEGDTGIANRFFYDAFKRDEELLAVILPEWFTLEMKEAEANVSED